MDYIFEEQTYHSEFNFLQEDLLDYKAFLADRETEAPRGATADNGAYQDRGGQRPPWYRGYGLGYGSGYGGYRGFFF